MGSVFSFNSRGKSPVLTAFSIFIFAEKPPEIYNFSTLSPNSFKVNNPSLVVAIITLVSKTLT